VLLPDRLKVLSLLKLSNFSRLSKLPAFSKNENWESRYFDFFRSKRDSPIAEIAHYQIITSIFTAPMLPHDAESFPASGIYFPKSALIREFGFSCELMLILLVTIESHPGNRHSYL